MKSFMRAFLGLLKILDRVDAVLGKMREQRPETCNYVGADVAPVIDDHVEGTVPRGDIVQEFLVALITLEDRDSILGQALFWMDVDTDDLRPGKELLPHAQRFAAAGRIAIAAHPDLEERDCPMSQVPKVPLVCIGIGVGSFFVGTRCEGYLAQ